MKKVLAISCLHCGHLAGLVPPDWQIHNPSRRFKKLAKAQELYWKRYVELVRKNGPYHATFVLGDVIDGKGWRSGGTELITTDRVEQTDMAIEALKIIKTKSMVFTYGTPYHAGNSEDWEDIVAKHFKSKIGSHEWVNIDGFTFDLKHSPAGTSQVPHGRATGIARDWLWNALWAERKRQPKANVILRGHSHYYQHVGGHKWTAMTIPVLQADDTKFGGRKCVGLVDWGITIFTIKEGKCSWETEIEDMLEVCPKVIRL